MVLIVIMELMDFLCVDIVFSNKTNILKILLTVINCKKLCN